MNAIATKNASIVTRGTHPVSVTMDSQATGTFLSVATDLMTAVVGGTATDRAASEEVTNRILTRVIKKAGFEAYNDKTKVQVAAVTLNIEDRKITVVADLINQIEMPRARRTEIVITRATLILNFK